MDSRDSDSLDDELASASSYCKRMFSSTTVYRCPYCHKVFSFNSRLEIHMRTHTGEKPFQCNICLKEFSDSSNFQVHLRCHSGQKSYQCGQCSKAYYRPNSLIRHETIKHGRNTRKQRRSTLTITKPENISYSDEKTLPLEETKCSYCDKVCTNAITLKRHERTHMGEKPFQCSLCQKEFSDNSNYHRHMRSHTGERNFKCSTCSKSFCRNDVLLRHEIEMHNKQHQTRKRKHEFKTD